MRQKLVIVYLFAAFVTSAQTASIKKVELAGEKIVVHYDLEDSNPANEYQITLYSSQSNFATALTKVSGDVGNEIKAGANKKIEWKLAEEIGPYKGKLALEIRGKVFIPIARINNISEGDKFKRGAPVLVTWKPGSNNPVNIELLKNGAPVSTQLNQPNTGAFNLPLPIHTKIGNDYTLKISDSKNPLDLVVSQPFGVKRKIPLLLKVAPVFVVGGAVLLLGGSDSKGGNTIPDPPHPD
jgi:hypothetical protein